MSVLRLFTPLVAALLLVCGTAGPAAGRTGQAEPGDAFGGSVLKTGWWWKANETPLDETTVPPPQLSPPNVPKGTLPVSTVNGEPEKLSAIEFTVAAKKGSLVESFVLAVRESEQAGVNVNQDAAKVAACPVTDVFWADGQSAKWNARPSYDCDLGLAPGVRSKDGVWRFDLTMMAGLWLSPTSTRSPSVVLVEQGEAPESFQVVYDGPKADGIGLHVVTSPAPAGLGGGGAGAPPPPGPVSEGGVGGGPLTSSSGSGGAAPSSPPLDAAGAPPPAEAAPEAAPAADSQLVSTAAAGPPWYAGIPRGGLLLVPFALGLAYLVMLALGPDAQPATATAQHGVGRALDRLRRMRAQVATNGLGR